MFATAIAHAPETALAAALPLVAQAPASILIAPSFPVPFSKLYLSPNNVRAKKTRTVESVRALAAMIEADGLLSDLQVSDERDVGGAVTGRYGVEAGGRRWMAIGLLIAEKRWPEDLPVSCKRVAPGRATGVSLAENISQEPMHPADEFAAFAKLIAEGKTVEQVAQHFGVKAIEVQRRMRLAAVAPSLVAQFRQGTITLDQMMAFASTPDQKRQVAVWKALPEYQRSASSIRRRLTEDEVPASDPRVKLIGLERYKASGGAMRHDLFTEDSFLEAGLVDLIAAEVLADAAERVKREGWAWVEVFESMGYEERERFGQAPVRYLPESDAQQRQREALQAKLVALEERRYECEERADASDEDDSDANAQLNAQIDTIDGERMAARAQLEALQRARIDTSGHDKATLGAVVTTDAGVLKIMRGMMLAKDAKVEQQRQNAIARGEAAGSVAPKAAEFSEKLMADLTSHRTAAMQAALAENVPVALAVLADRLCSQVFTLRGDFSHGYGQSGAVLQISLKQCEGALGQNGTGMVESEAAKRVEQQRDRWQSLMPATAAERLSWLLDQPQETVLALIAFCAAVSADVIARRHALNEQADAIAGALRLDMADWWSVGVDNFLTHVSKAKIAAIVTEAHGAEAAAPLAAMKKGDACAKAAELLVGCRWLPTPMRVGVVDTTASAGASGQADTDAA